MRRLAPLPGLGPVDVHYRLSGSLGRITPAKDSDPEPPPVGAGGRWLGVKPTTNAKDEIDMHSVPQSDVPPPPACPNCGRVADRTATRRSDGFITADSLCPAGHIWTMRWMEVA